MSEQLPQPFTIDVSEAEAGLSVVALAGEIDMASSAELERQLGALEGAEGFQVVVDLAGLTFIDSSGIRALVVAAKAIESRGGTVLLAAPSPNIERVFVTVHLSEVIPVRESLEAALADARQAVAGGR